MKRRPFAFVLALCILLPTLLLGTAAEEPEMNFDITDGELISGTRTITYTCSGSDDCAILLDGKALSANDNADLTFTVTPNGVDYKGALFLVGEETVGEMAKLNAEQQFPLKKTCYGDGVFDIVFMPTLKDGVLLDPNAVYGTYNIDDVDLYDAAIILPTGERVNPVSVIWHYPIVGKGGTRDEEKPYQSKTPIGDGWNASTNLGGTMPDNPIYVTFRFDLSENESFKVFHSGLTLFAELDTTAYPDGEHTLTFVCGGSKKDIKVLFDNTAPTVNVSVKTGDLLTKNDTITATSDEDNVKISMSIDGSRYNGKELYRTIEQNTKTHLLSVCAIDACGNTSYTVVEFRLSDGDEDTYEFVELPSKSVLSFSEDGKVLTVNDAPTTKNENTFTVEAGENKELILQCKATSSEHDHVLLSVLNTKTNEYEPLRTFPSEDIIYLEYTVTPDTVKDGKVTFKIEEYIHTSPSDTMIWVSDTQYYTRFEDERPEYECVLDYYAELYKKGEAGFLLHTGDVADQYTPEEDARAQMKVASELHKKLDDQNIPYGIVDGNHDAGHALADSKYFVEVFGSKRFEQTPWFYGTLDNNTHHYDLVTLDGNDFLLLWLGYGVEATPEVIAWVNMVLDKYPDRNAIILTHAYLDTDNDWVINLEDTSAYNHSRAKEIWENYVVPHNNVVAVFCGHTPGVARNLRKVDDTRSVWEVLADYQFVNVKDPNHMENYCNLDGEGYIRIVSFADGKMTQKTYSPFLDDWDYFDVQKDEFTVDLPLQESKRTLTIDTFNCFTKTGTLTGGTGSAEGKLIVMAGEFSYEPAKPEPAPFPLVPVLIGAGVLVLAAVITVLLVLKKKKAGK